MIGIINGFDFWSMESQKYYATPASWTDEKKKQLARDRIFSDEWYGARKRDGSWWMFIKDEDGNMMLRGRSKGVDGTFPDKIEWVPHLNAFFDSLPNGTVFLGELYLPSQEQSRYVTTILGCLKEKAITRQEKGEKLNYYIFDILSFDGELFYNRKFIERIEKMKSIRGAYNDTYIEWSNYVHGEQLWTTLQSILANGGEGMVITHESAHYEPGKRPSKTTLKIKKEVQQTIDAFFTGKFSAPTEDYTGKEIENWTYWINEITGERIEGKLYKDYIEKGIIKPVTKPFFNKWAGSMEIGLIKNGKITPIGFLSGVTDEIKAHPQDYSGRVIEIAAMQIDRDANGNYSGLRHGKMLGFREDKIITDCTWDQLEQ